MMQPPLQTEKIMPLIHITLAGPSVPPVTIERLQQETTRLMQTILRKEAALTVVCISQLPAGACAANGLSVSAAASLQAMITAGTNSTAEKAAFVAAAKAMLTGAIGPSDAPMYVMLHELPADS
jgi:4-oxalocrotonate tautomerase